MWFNECRLWWKTLVRLYPSPTALKKLPPVRPKTNPVFRATRTYLSESADPRLFLQNIPLFFVGVFIIEVSILKKSEPTLPKVFKTVALNTRLFFWPKSTFIFDYIKLRQLLIMKCKRKKFKNSILFCSRNQSGIVTFAVQKNNEFDSVRK